MTKNKGKDNTFGRRIAQLRRACGLTQEALANELYMARSTLANYESNRRNPDIILLQKLSKKFDVSINYLLNNPEDEANELAREELDIEQYLIDGKLDLSDAPPLVKIILVNNYLFLMQKIQIVKL